MKKFIALLLTAFLIISFTACGESSENKKITEPKVSQMKSICELAVMDCYYHNVAKYNEKNASGWWLWTQDKEFWIEYSGIVTLGVDVSLVSMEIDGDKDEDGNIIPETIYIRFKHPAINDRLAKFAKTKKWQENLLASKDAFPSEEAFQQEVAQMNETCEQIKQHLVDTNIVVKKGVSGIDVKVYPEK